MPPPPNFVSTFLLGLFWAYTHLARFTFLFSSAKIDGRRHIGKETVDKGWPDNFLIGKRFGQSLIAAPKKRNRHVVKKGKATALKYCYYYI